MFCVYLAHFADSVGPDFVDRALGLHDHLLLHHLRHHRRLLLRLHLLAGALILLLSIKIIFQTFKSYIYIQCITKKISCEYYK